MTIENLGDNGDGFGESPSKYDIPSILLEYVHSMLPDEEELEGVEVDLEELMLKAVFICATAWNIATFPQDCSDEFLKHFEQTYKQNDSHDSWDELHEDLLAMAEDMKESYPDADCIITDQELEVLPDGSMSFDIDVIPLHEAIALMRDNI